VAIEKFTGELDEVFSEPTVTKFTGELDEVLSEPTVAKFTGVLDGETPAQEAPVAQTQTPVTEQAPPTQAAAQAQAPVAEQAPPALGEPTQEELAAASQPAFVYRKPGNRAAPVTDPNAINMPGSVMDRQVAPPSKFEQTSKAPIRPEVRAAFNSQWDAATPEQREILAQQPGLTGQLAREREELFTKQAEALGGVPADSTLRKVDPRIEERRARLIAEGEDPEFAALIARLSTERGVPPGQEIAAIGTIEPSEFDFETNRFFRDQVGANNPVVRGTAKAVLGLGKATLGINEFLADSIGADKYAKFLKEGNKWIREKEGAVGEKGGFLERNLEGAISSIGQQLPWMIGAAATGGGTAIPLIAMGLQSFGQEYSDGRSRKQDVQQAATRASIFAAFEVIGEKFGLSDQLKALRGAAKGMDNSQIIGLLANALKKEVPGELFTTTGQFAADKWMPQGYALNPNATVEDFVKQVADTIAQTVLQAGVMGAGTTGVSTVRRFMGERGYGAEIAAADAETARTAALQKAANMFKPATPRAKASEQPTTEQQLEETSEFNEYGYINLPEYQELVKKREAASEQFTVLSDKADSLPEGSDERNEVTRAANKFFADFYQPLSAQLDAIEQAYASQAPAPAAETAPTTETARVEPSFTVDPETGEVITTQAEPVESDTLIEREAQRYAKTYNLPLDLATEVVRGQYARGELEDESRTGVDAGRTEPSISMPVEGAATAEGVTPSDTSGLADTVGDTRGADVGERAERTALDESLIPTLTERAPAPTPAATYAELPVEDKAPVLQEAQQMWQAGEANLPMAKAWNSLPSWKRDMFAAQVYENYDEITTNPEAFRAAIDKVVEAKKPADVKAAAPAATTPEVFDVDYFNKELARLKNKVSAAERVERRAEMGPDKTAAEQKLAKANQEIDAFFAKQSPLFNAAADKTIAESEEREAKKTAATTPEVITTPTAPKRGRPAKPVVEGAEPKTPKPRGRKKIQLTPEEQALKDAERGVNQAEAIKAARDVDKLIKFLSSEFDPANTKSPDFTKVATQGLDSVRREYIYKLNEFATKNAYRTKPASGGKARDFLTSSDKITQKERADLQARLNFEKTRPPKPSAARSRSTEKPVKAFYKFDRASQAIDYIMRNGTPFERALAARLKPLVGDVRLTVADTKENTPDAIQDLLGDAAGVYSSAQFGDKVHRMIVLRGENFDDPALQGVNNIIFLHEALHAATEAKIDQWQELTSLGLPVPPQLQMLVNDLFEVMGSAQAQYETLKASGQPISANLRHKFEKLDISNDPKEFVAYGMTDPDVQKFLLNAPGYTRKDQALGYIKNLFNQFVNSIRRSFNMDAKHQSAMQDLMLVTEGLMQEQEIEPAYSVNTVLDAKVSKSDKALEKVQLSIQSNETPKLLGEAAEVRTFENYQNALQDNWAAMSAGAKSAILIAMPTQDIVRWKGKEIPALKDIDLTTQLMAGMRQNLLEAYSKQADVLGKFARKAGKDGMDKMATAMHLARLESVSPSLYADRVDALQRDPKIIQLSAEAANPAVNVNERAAIDQKLNERRTAINNVFDAWEALDGVKDGHKMYKMVRQFYKDSGALTRALLDRHIDSLGLEGEVNDPNTPKGRLMLSVRRMYEDGDAKGVIEYFPFMRHGEHVLEVAGPSGREVYFFDTASDRNKFISKRAKQIGADRKDGNVFKAYRYDNKDTRDKFAAESRMLTDMFNAIEDATDATALDKEMLKDDLYQIYLTTLPEQSFRKRFLHADNVTGFSSDIFRNFKTSATQIATQAAKLRYGPEMHNAMERASDTLQGMPPLMQAELSPFIAEVNKRAQDELVQPEDNKIAKGLNQFAFYWLLTGVASAAIQTTALPMYVMPKLNTDYGYGPSAAKFAKWMNVYKSFGVTTEDVDGNVVMTAPTMGESKLVRENPIFQRAFAEAKARNLFGQSFSNVISDRRRTPDNAYDNLPRVMLRNTANVMSGLFTGAERLTREASFMIAFELEYNKSGDFDKAVEKATDVVQEFIGRFDSFSRARIMRNPVGMVVGQFKPYAAIVTSFLVRNAYKALKVTNPKEALKSAHLLGSIILMGGLFHGVTGMPLYSFMVDLLYAVLDGLEDEDEKRKRIAKNPLIAENPDFRFRYEFLPKYFGDIKLPATDGRYYPLSSMLEKGPLSVATDLNIGSRTGLDGIWFKTPKVGKDLQEKTANWLEAFLPAAVSAGKNVVKGIDTINDGKILQGMSEMLPAFFANPVKTVRIAEEGATTRKGQQILGKEELSDTNIIAQVTGLQSTRVAQLQEQAFKYQSEIIRATNARNSLIGKLDDVFIDQKATDKDRKTLMNQIAQHNKRYPMQGVAIDPDTIFRSIDNSIKNRGLTFRGMQIKENLLPYILPIRMQLDRAVSGKE
jgi:hypothetical protein